MTPSPSFWRFSLRFAQRRKEGFFAMSITACHNCQKGVGDWCIPCNRISQDDIRIQRQPHNKSEFQATTVQPKGEQVTPFSEETENALRIFLSTLAQLPTATVVIFHSFLRGRTLNETAKFMGESKATTYARMKNSIECFPWLAGVYRTGKRRWTNEKPSSKPIHRITKPLNMELIKNE